MANTKSIISMQNKEVIMEKKIQAVKSNCINKPDCPLSNQCQITNITYKSKITSNLQNYHGKICTTEPAKIHLNSDMETITNHSIIKSIGQIQNFEGILET